MWPHTQAVCVAEGAVVCLFLGKHEQMNVCLTTLDGALVSRPKIHFHLSLACWSSKPTGVAHRTGVATTHPSIGNDSSSGWHRFIPRQDSQTASARSLLPFMRAMEETSKFPQVLVNFRISLQEGTVCLFGRKQMHSSWTISHRFCYLKGNAFWESPGNPRGQGRLLGIHRTRNQCRL